MADEEKEELRLYTLSQKTDDGTYIIEGYAYGLPWVKDALWEGDICLPTPEAAKEWWDRRYGS